MLSWGVSALETGLPLPGTHPRLLLHTSARGIMGGGQGMPPGWWGVGGGIWHFTQAQSRQRDRSALAWPPHPLHSGDGILDKLLPASE